MTTTTTDRFTVDAAAALGGPDWLRARRIESAERVAAGEWPTTDEEVWRYSRVDDLDVNRYAPLAGGAPGPASEVPAEVEELLAGLPRRAGTVVVVDGRVARCELAPRWAERGVVLAPLADHDHGPALLGSVATPAPDLFAELNAAFAVDPVGLSVPAGVDVDEPVVVAHWINEEASATFPRLVVRVGEDASATVVDHRGSADVDALVVPVTELDVAAAGRLAYLDVQELGHRVWQVASQVSQVGQDATLTSTSAAIGGSYARLRTDCRLTGRGATGDLLSVYFGEDDQMLDLRTFQDHRAPDTTSNLLFKGAVGGRARSVYTGVIRVRPDARGTNAFQTNRNVKLSDHAWAESVPNLEIENNEVQCSHASAVGPIDAEQRFYLESRGVRPEMAERLVVAGFFDDVLTRLSLGEMVAPLQARIAAKLDRQVIGA